MKGKRGSEKRSDEEMKRCLSNSLKGNVLIYKRLLKQTMTMSVQNFKKIHKYFPMK